MPKVPSKRRARQSTSRHLGNEEKHQNEREGQSRGNTRENLSTGISYRRHSRKASFGQKTSIGDYITCTETHLTPAEIAAVKAQALTIVKEENFKHIASGLDVNQPTLRHGLTKLLSTIKDGLVRYCNTKTSRNGVNNMWILKNSTSLLSSLDQLDVRTAKSVQTFDFSTLYTSIPHDLLKSRISNLVHNAFRKKDGSVRYTHIKLTRAKGYFTHNINGGRDNMFTADSICEMIEFLIDNIFVQFGGRLFRQVIGIPMGTNCAPLLADLFLYSYENEFLDNMIRSGHRRLARSFNLCYRYIDDLIVFNNKKFLDYLKEIYPSQLTVEKANKSDHLADYLDLTFIIDSGGKLSTRLYDKRDDFDFHIVNFPFLSSNIPSGPSYGVYISQLIRYARCCSHCDDFRYRHKCLVDRLLSQGYKALRLEKSFKKFYGRYQDLIEKYRRSVNAMVSDSFPGQFLFNM